MSMQTGKNEAMMRFKQLVFGISSLVLLGMLAGFGYVPEQLSRLFGAPSNSETTLAIRELESRNSALATKIREISDPRDKQAIESLLRAESSRHRSTVSLAEEIARNDIGFKAWKEVARTAYNPELSSNSEERKEFIFAHGMILDSMQNIKQATKRNANNGSKREADSAVDTALDEAYGDFLKDLSKLDANPKEFRPVAHDPIGVMLFNEVEDKSIRSYYLDETNNESNQDWLHDVIAQCVRPPTAGIEEDSNDLSPGVTVGDVVSTAYRFHPVFRDMVLDDASLNEDERRPVPVILAMFQEYGEFVKIATGNEFDVARSDILDVIFANTDYLDRWTSVKGSSNDSWEKLAAHFSQLQRSKPNVWREARYSPLALRLNDEAPQFANKVLEMYGQDDIAALIFSGYEQEVLPATESIFAFGDLAIYILQKYADEPGGSNWLFHQALKNQKCGIRVIPYIALRDDQGLTDLEENIKWADKYFDERGKPRNPDWYEAVPFVGASAKIVSNIKNGSPSSWEELGWAAFDIADVGFTIATLGGGSIVTKTLVSGKTTILATGKKAAKSTLKRFASRQVAQQARKKIGESLLRKVAILPKLKGLFSPAPRRIWSAMAIAKKMIQAGYLTAIQTANTIKKRWGKLPATIRKMASRGMIAALIYVRLAYRSLPTLNSLGWNTGDLIHLFDDPMEAFSSYVSNAINHLLCVGVLLIGWLTYLGVCILLLMIAWKARPWARRRLNYV